MVAFKEPPDKEPPDKGIATNVGSSQDGMSGSNGINGANKGEDRVKSSNDEDGEAVVAMDNGNLLPIRKDGKSALLSSSLERKDAKSREDAKRVERKDMKDAKVMMYQDILAAATTAEMFWWCGTTASACF